MKRNLVLLSIDSLRADHCGFIEGGPSGLTPTLDAMAEEGIVFENAITPGPRTPSSMPDVFTGDPVQPVQPDQNSDLKDYWQRRRAYIRRHMRCHTSIAKRLREQGYSTVGVTANPWTQGTEFDAGFDRFIEVNSQTLETYGSPVFRRIDGMLSDNPLGDRLSWYNKREWFIRWTDFYERILDELESVPRPFFLWVFLLDTHQPYITPSRYRHESSSLGMYYTSFTELSRNGRIPAHVEKGLQKAYRDSVRSTDAFVSRLQKDCVDDDPVFVVHADHGEAFGEHGTYGHERQLYGENLHVPLVISNTGQQERISEPLSLQRLSDIITTLATSETLVPERFTTDFVVSTTEGCEKTAVSGGSWRYIQNGDDEELYHLTSDASEQVNLALDSPAITAALRSLAERWQRDRHERTAIADTVRVSGVERPNPPGDRSKNGVTRNE